MHIWAMILAAGQGTRLAEATNGVPKQFLEMNGVPLYWSSARLFASCARVRGLVFVFPPDCLEREVERLGELGIAELGLPWGVTAGGAERRDSVRLGLPQLGRDCDAVLVHDAARPFASPSLVNRVMDALEGGHEGVVPGIAVTDTIKEVAALSAAGDGARAVIATPPREGLAAVQTPQGFRLSVLRQAHAQAASEAWAVTDDASLLERLGRDVVVVAGEIGNKKITSPEDLAMLRKEKPVGLFKTGFGYDVHKFASCPDTAGNGTAERRGRTQPSRPLRLGGVAIPGGLEVLAHSDGDVLLHALMDGVLGCAGAGDIGQLFPDSDPAFSGCDSAILLDEVLRVALAAGLRLVHVDLTVITQVPKVAPHREAIRRNVATLLGLDAASVNVKATSEEGLGFTGEKLGIKAVAVVTALANQEDAGEKNRTKGGRDATFDTARA